MAAFTSQSGIKQKGMNKGIDYSTDNLFAGTWRLDQSNLERFDPFVAGYAFIIWTKLPQFFDSQTQSQFKNLTEKNFKSFSGISDITLNVDDMTTGFNGNAYGVATGIAKENTSFSITHYELAGSPVRELYQYWVTGIRDFETGLATYHGAIADGSLEYSAKNHTGEFLYIVTDPSGATGSNRSRGIEYAAYYTNVMPTKIPQDHLNYSSGDHTIAEITMDFRGNYHQSKEINELAVAAMDHYQITKTFGDYQVNRTGMDFSGFRNEDELKY